MAHQNISKNVAIDTREQFTFSNLGGIRVTAKGKTPCLITRSKSKGLLTSKASKKCTRQSIKKAGGKCSVKFYLKGLTADAEVGCRDQIKIGSQVFCKGRQSDKITCKCQHFTRFMATHIVRKHL